MILPESPHSPLKSQYRDEGVFRLSINMNFDHGGDDGFIDYCNYMVAKKPMAYEAGGSIGFCRYVGRLRSHRFRD